MSKRKRKRSKHARAVQVRTTERLKAWHKNHKDDEDTAEKLKSVGDIAAYVDGQLKQKGKEG